MKYELEKHGVTQGLLQRFLNCRRSAELFLEGWQPKESHSEALNFGTITHAVLEKVYIDIKNKKIKSVPNSAKVNKYTKIIEKQFYKENPRASKKLIEMTEASLGIAEKTIPLYLDYWKKDDFKKYRWKAVEKEFCHTVQIGDYKIPVRGKRDGDIYREGYWLFETKTKSQINEVNLLDTLWFEFQTNVYLWSMVKEYGKYPKGCIYNVIRRSCLKQKKNETLKQYADRISEDIQTRPEFYFIRYQVDILRIDMVAFEKQMMKIISDFVAWYRDKKNQTYKNTFSCISKYGQCWALPICSEENYVRYTKRDTVFRELEEL